MTRRATLYLLASLLLAGCVRLPSPSQPVTYHVLTDPGPVVPSTRTHTGTLLVREMDASGLYQVSNLVFSRNPGTRTDYQFARWSEPPAKRLTWLIRQRLEAAGAFAVVSPLGGGVRGDYQLNTRLIDFYHEASTPPGVALLIIEAELVRRSDARLIARRMFVGQENVTTHDAQGAADAMGRAATQVIDALTLWLTEAAAPEPR